MSEIDPQPVTGDGADGQPKSAKQLEKEAKKAAKLQKLQQKIEKKSTAVPSGKDKAEVRFEFFLMKLFTIPYQKKSPIRKSHRKSQKRPLFTQPIQSPVKRKIFLVHCQMRTVLSMLKLLGMDGGKNKAFSNRNTVVNRYFNRIRKEILLL